MGLSEGIDIFSMYAYLVNVIFYLFSSMNDQPIPQIACALITT